MELRKLSRALPRILSSSVRAGMKVEWLSAQGDERRAQKKTKDEKKKKSKQSFQSLEKFGEEPSQSL